ncbi:hypothetical protein SASPL_138328 [Salvia splendens]|uniref:Protein TILLER ANGLE CONTROL 1 n=1 Tax=Salvia splendens TaxID=180675 RepID=A0A8X8ZE12_SALSN|nr:hypothetical protein SASPL_138328 [Salvia splendens]
MVVGSGHAAENVKKNSDIARADEQQFVGENECDVVLESWRGGILAIGTFGYDPLKHQNQQLTEAYFSEDDCDDDDDVDDDSSSLIDQRGGNPLVLAEEEEEEEEEDGELEFGFEYVMMKKKERTTLADLFVADCDEDECGIANAKSKSHHLPTQKSSRKHAPSFARTARPIHKLNKVTDAENVDKKDPS